MISFSIFHAGRENILSPYLRVCVYQSLNWSIPRTHFYHSIRYFVYHLTLGCVWIAEGCKIDCFTNSCPSLFTFTSMNATHANRIGSSHQNCLWRSRRVWSTQEGCIMSVASSFDVINRQNLQFATPRYEKLSPSQLVIICPSYLFLSRSFYILPPLYHRLSVQLTSAFHTTLYLYFLSQNISQSGTNSKANQSHLR